MAAAEPGGATADGEALTAATLAASSLGDEAFADAAEPIVVVESLTVLSEVPLGAGARDSGDAGDESGGGLDGPDRFGAPQRWLMIAERAYLLAAERGFEPGGELEDWLRAEREVDTRLAGR